MTGIIACCRQCGATFEPDRADIIAGAWRTCPACQALATATAAEEPHRCSECGRPLRAGKRTLCYSCLTGGAGL